MENYYKFNTVQEVEEWVLKTYTNEELNELCVNNIESPLFFYKGNGYNFMNECIRAGFIGTCEEVDIKGLQDLLLSKTINESIQVYRFVDLKESYILWKNTRKNREYDYPSFLSTTLLKNQYSMENIKRNRYAISILIPKGTPGTFIPEVNRDFPEYEVLFPHHTKLRKKGWRLFEVVL